MRNALTLYRRLDRGPLTTAMSDFDEIFSRALQNQGFQTESPSTIKQKELFQPNVELEDSENSYLLSFDLPGVKREDIKIDIHLKTLIVSGERKCETRDQAGRVSQRSGGHFERRFILPETVQTERIEAKLQDGVLELLLPKAELAKPRSIEIHSAQS